MKIFTIKVYEEIFYFSFVSALERIDALVFAKQLVKNKV